MKRRWWDLEKWWDWEAKRSVRQVEHDREMTNTEQATADRYEFGEHNDTGSELGNVDWPVL